MAVQPARATPRHGEACARTGSGRQPRLHTALTSRDGAWRLSVPLVGAPMAGAAGGALAAAVSNGGGLGFVAVGHGLDLAALRREVGVFRRAASPGARLALGFVGHSACAAADGGGGGGGGGGEGSRMPVLEQVLAEHAPAVVQFFAPAIVDGGANVRLAQDAGALVRALG